ncbi:MAG: sugar phosphate isomerase/epimerase [Actinobacteria bacterium]|nr:sugar phosphate isomerase/epimerase [Actinomycetota bacterium]MBO0834187.1 sugar phosphate isomerase/epimerase [Actinomycetota bacterium]
MTVILSGFADEISPDLDEQLATLAAESISHLELRSVWSTNVADVDDAQLTGLRRRLGASGVGVSAIGSPIGKIDIEAPLEPELERLRRIADVAHLLGTNLVRVFSFFMPEGRDPQLYRGQVIDRMRALAEIAEERGLVLAHENEKNIYGDRPERCADIIESVSSPALRATFDAANFVQCGVRPHSDGYELLRPYLVYVQVKDALMGTGEVVPAGQGDGQVKETVAALRDSGFNSYLSLEPHLATSGRFGGFSGPDGFRLACRALKDLLADLSVPWE